MFLFLPPHHFCRFMAPPLQLTLLKCQVHLLSNYLPPHPPGVILIGPSWVRPLADSRGSTRLFFLAFRHQRGVFRAFFPLCTSLQNKRVSGFLCRWIVLPTPSLLRLKNAFSISLLFSFHLFPSFYADAGQAFGLHTCPSRVFGWNNFLFPAFVLLHIKPFVRSVRSLFFPPPFPTGLPDPLR